MEQRPSEKMLAILRDGLAARGMNSAALAQAVEADRKQVRRVLSGQDALTVDQFVLWATVLELDVAALLESEPPSGPVLLNPPTSNLPVIDPYGIPAEQVIRLAFGLGVDFFLVADTNQLAESGIPAGVLETHPDRLGIKLDAAFHPQNHPQFSDEGVTMTLSFTGLHTCVFPWSSILSVSMELGTPMEDPPNKPKGLRLVKG